MSELLEISDQLLDETADPAQVPALQARRRQLTAVRNLLQQPPPRSAPPLQASVLAGNILWTTDPALLELHLGSPIKPASLLRDDGFHA